MAEINKPDLTNNWGSLGGIIEPDSTKIGLGWQEGESPLCEWQNWWQNRADASLSYLYQKGVPEWDASTEYITNKSIVNYQGNLYLCTTTNTNTLPTNASFWKRTGLALSDLPDASTSVKGIVQLNDTLSSTSTSLALTANQGKVLEDNKVPKTTTVNSKALSGNIVLNNTDIGLGNVDNVKQLPNSYLDTSGTLASDSDVKVPSQKAVKTYADSKLSKTSNLSDVANTATARTNLGLTSAATTAVTANNLDTTSGRLLRVGDFGVGIQIAIPDSANLNTYTVPGNYGQSSNTFASNGTNYPIPNAGVLIVEKSGANSTSVIQKYTKFDSSESYTRAYDGSTWSAWDRTVTASMTGTAYTRNYTTSTTLAANSDSNVPTEKAVKTYADTKVPKTTTVNSKALSGNIVLDKTDIGLGNVDNTQQLPMSYLDTSTTLAGNSDTKVPSQKAVRTYVDSKVGETPFRNRIINGDFLVNQRRGGDAITLTSSAYNADRWFHAVSQSSKASSQTIVGSSAVGSRNYLRMKTVSAVTLGSGDDFGIMQSIEGNNVYDFNFGTAAASQITLSFWVRASQTGTYSVSFRNDGGDRSYVTTYTISTANTWEYKTITVNGDTSGTWKNDTSTGLKVYFDFGSGSTFTTASPNTWLAGNFVKSTGTTSLITTLNATLDLALVQLEKGGAATSFEYLHVADSIARCGRYYQKLLADSRGYAPGVGHYTGSAIQFRTQMRVTPTAALITGIRGNVSSVSVLDVTLSSARHVISSAGGGDFYAVGETAVFDAEL